MSKPTFNFFCVHTGYYRNDRMLALRERIGNRAFRVMPMVWSWASENQMDGDVSDMSDGRWRQIFNGCYLKLALVQTRKIMTAIQAVGFIQEGKFHSWDKFNRHLVHYEKCRTIKQTADFVRWKQKVEGTEQPESNTAANGKQTPFKQLWMLDSALKTACGRAETAHARARPLEPRPAQPKARFRKHRRLDARGRRWQPRPGMSAPCPIKPNSEVGGDIALRCPVL